jgi:hypothetical protein
MKTIILTILITAACQSYGQEILSDAKPLMVEASTGALNYPALRLGRAEITNGITVTANWGWEDLRFPANALRTQGAANVPTFDSFVGGLYLFSFSGTTLQQIYGVAQFPHTWRTNSAVKAHVHTTNGSTVTTNASVWKLEYTWVSVHGTNPTTTITVATTNAWTGTAYTHNMWEFADIDGAGQTESSILTFRLYRDPTDAGDAQTDGEWLYEFDIHYQIEKPTGEVF